MALGDFDNRIPIATAARELGVETSTIRHWRVIGAYSDIMPVRQAVNRRLFVLREELDALKAVYLGKEEVPAS